MEQLKQFGWTDEFSQKWRVLAEPGLVPARVVADFGTSLKVVTPATITAELSGKLAHYTAAELTPKVGDWVGVRLLSSGTAVIEVLIPRRNEIARKVNPHPDAVYCFSAKGISKSKSGSVVIV